jgi:hypothetical protein
MEEPDNDFDELMQLEAEVETIRRNVITEASRKSYTDANAKFLLWLYDNKRHILTEYLPPIIAAASNTRAAKKAVYNFIYNADLNHPPIHFSQLTTRVFMTYIVYLRKLSGGIGNSKANNIRAALFNLFREYHQVMPASLQSELKNSYKGLKRENATSAQGGSGQIKVGKEPLDFPFFRFIALNMLKQAGADFVFGHTILVLTWNLICRVSNGAGIHFNHMEWRNDALAIYFVHQKNDQSGERPRDPRHIYANPITPEICPILTLGIYFACNPILNEGVFALQLSLNF